MPSEICMMKPMAKGELKSVLQEYYMLSNYLEKHKGIFGKAFEGMPESNRSTLQIKLTTLICALEDLKNNIEECVKLL